MIPRTIVQAFLKLSGYDRDKLLPGYHGKFVIQLHSATNLHFDLRLEFPVTSLHDSLGQYEGKRLPGTPEPMEKYPDKPGTVLRSFAVRKHKIPSGTEKLFIVETEDHPLSYFSFSGEIAEGYGKGKVDVWDHGTYELLDVEGDKKYTIDFKGKKLRGIFALVKYQNGYLWVKTKNKEASAIDYVRPTMNEQLWDLSQTPPKLLKSIRNTILRTLVNTCEESGLINPFQWITGLSLSGSSTGFNYQEDGDVDIDITYDIEKFKNAQPELEMDDDYIFTYLKNAIYKANERNVGGTSLPYSFMILEPGDKPTADAIYDLLKDEWLTLPVKIPENFDPDIAFAKQKKIAWDISQEIDLLIGSIVRIADDLSKIDQYVRHYGKLMSRRVMILAKLKEQCQKLDNLNMVINKMTIEAKNSEDPIYPAFDFSPNWDERQIIFKYLARSGYHRPIARLYERLEKGPILEVINRIIPD